MTQILQKLRIFEFFYNFRQFFVQFSSILLSWNGLRNSTMNSPGISNRQFWRDNCIFCCNWLKTTQKSRKQQKSTFCDKLILIFDQTTKIFEKQNFQWPERWNKKVFKTQLRKKCDEVHQVYNKGVKGEEITAFFVAIGLKNVQKSMKQRKNTLFDKRIPIFVQTNNAFEEEIFRWHERWNNKVFKTQLGKFIEFTTKLSKFQNSLYFRQHSPNFVTFPKNYFNQE